MPSEPVEEVEIRPLEPGDNCSGFSFGDRTFQPLKSFIQKDAANFQDIEIARTYVAISSQSNKVRGFITLLCSQIELDHDRRPNEVERADAYRDYPAVKIARLGVHKAYQGTGLGSALMDLAVQTAIDRIRPYVGCRFLIVDSKNPSIGFYQRFGFTLLGQADLDDNGEHFPMYLDLLPYA